MNPRLLEARARIGGHLRTAAQVELATLPPYLSAMWSLQPGHNREAHEVLRSVLMEEMLHLTLAANVLSAIGGAADFRSPQALPAYPLLLEFDAPDGQRHRVAPMHLQAFSREALHGFMQVELPSDAHEAPAPAVAGAAEVPAYTVGQLYAAVEAELVSACAEFGEAAVFIGDPTHQIPEDFYWHGGGRPVVVRNLRDAAKALGAIRAQGEGAHGGVFDVDRELFDEPDEVAHYYRLEQLLLGRRYRAGDAPHQPSGAAVPVDFGAVQPLRPDCRASDYAGHPGLQALNDRFNAAYTMMMWQLSEGFAGNPAVFYTAIQNGMKALGPLARALMALPFPGDPEQRHAAPTFEWNAAGAGLLD